MTEFERELRDLTDQDVIDLYERCRDGAGDVEEDARASEIERRGLDI